MCYGEGMLKDFKKFILRGNVVDLAVAVVIGAAFSAVIQSLVANLITPMITGITGTKSGAAVQGILHLDILSKNFIFNWGAIVSAAISFLLIAAVVFFLVVQPINKLTTIANRNKVTEEPSTRKCTECLSEVPKLATRCAFCTTKLAPVKLAK
jgi:large conductance mechanosensitive channel